MRHSRFEAIRLRLERFDPGTGWRLWLYEFVLFGFKQGWACLFGGLMLALLLATHFLYPENAALHRYDFLTLSAIAIQAAMLAFRLETWAEAKIILIFHIVGTVMELFKTAAGSWIYPEASVLHIGAVPLFSGFMYAAVGSYIAGTLSLCFLLGQYVIIHRCMKDYLKMTRPKEEPDPILHFLGSNPFGIPKKDRKSKAGRDLHGEA